ncbi:MAG: hypothetical protein AAFV98_03860 [Chloroflexota bacterium]
MKKIRIVQVGVMLVVMLMSMGVASAQVIPSMRLNVGFTPNTQLTSIVADDRFVDMTINLTGNVQFWAVEMTCSVGGGTQLTFQDITFPEGQWGVENIDYIRIPTNANGQYQSGGTLSFTISRAGIDNTPLGISGASYSLPLASVRYQVANQNFNTTVTPFCFISRFLDRDGRIIANGIASSTPLRILVGYELAGNIKRQGATNHNNIEVQCTHYPTGFSNVAGTVYTTRTNFLGDFRFGGATSSTATNLLRDFGNYRCSFESFSNNTVNDEHFLDQSIEIDLQTPQYRIPPQVIRPGNFDRVSGDVNGIDLDDTLILTGNIGTFGAAFRPGDANGDTAINARDLAVVTSNFSLSQPIAPGNVIYGVGIDYDPRYSFPNSRAYYGNTIDGGTTRVNSFSNNREFWPQLSPDGTQIAFVRENTFTGRYDLVKTNTSNGFASAFSFPFGTSFSAFAPSWSPDGAQIAFICSEEDDSTGYLFNEGNICIVSAGSTFVQSVQVVATGAEIAPPAWLEADDGSYVLMYGRSNSTEIGYYDLDDGTTGVVNIDGDDVNEVDNPVVVNYLYDSTVYLAYRFSANGTGAPYIKMGTISYDGTGIFSGGVTGVVDNTTHEEYSTETTGVGYFDVASNLDILFYVDGRFGSNTNFQYLDNTNAAPPFGFNAASPIRPDGFVGMPEGFLFGGGLWNGDETRATLLHIQRATFDFVP